MSENYRLLILKNIATNGRTFCVLLCAICLALFLVRQNVAFAKLAVTAALPLAISWTSEIYSLASGGRSKVVPAISLILMLLMVGSVLFALATI